MRQDSSHPYAIARHRIKQDILLFGAPALLVFFTGLMVCSSTGRYDGLLRAMWILARDPSGFASVTAGQMLGLAMCVVGLSVAIAGAVTLKRFYSSSLVIRKDHELVTRGLYRFVRHPIYLGALTVIFGVPVYAASPLGALILAALIPLVLNRIRMEERLLEEEFGEAHRRYREKTKKLIPFVY